MIVDKSTKNKKLDYSDKFRAENGDKIHKGFIHRGVSSKCDKCKVDTRKLIRSYVLKDGSIKGTAMCLLCTEVTSFEHTKTCECRACSEAKSMGAEKKTVDKPTTDLSILNPILTILNKGSPKDLDPTQSKIFTVQFGGDKEALEAFIKVLAK